MNKVEKFEQALKEFGIGAEFVRVLEKSRYTGPVIFFDLRKKSLEQLGIQATKADELRIVFAYYIEIYEQMNSFILMDNHEKCCFFANKKICELMTKENDPQHEWMRLFPGAEVRTFIPEDLSNDFYKSEWHVYCEDAFSCIYLHHIPASCKVYDHELIGVENYFPRQMYFIMESIAKGNHRGVKYPQMCKNERVLEYAPKTVLWHRAP